MGADLFSIGVSGLIASQAALSTTSNNIANASTPGYTREVTILTPNHGQQSQYGYLGSGVLATSVQRQIDTYLNANVQSAQSVASEQDSYFQQVSQLSNALAATGTDIGSSIQTFFTGFQKVASDPASVPSRQQVISNAQTLVDQFQTVGAQISSINGSINQDISLSVASINNYAQQIATLNQSIKTVSQGGNAAPPNDLLDQRDAAVANLSKLVGVSVVTQSDGAYNVVIGNAQPLVADNQAYSLAAVPSTSDPSRTVVAFAIGGGKSPIPDSDLTGGSLGALASFRSQTLDPTSRSLGLLATGFATAVNNQHALGIDLKGRAGGPVFSLPAPKVLGAATNSSTAPSLTASFASSDLQYLQPSDYQVAFDGANYTITRLSDGTTGVDGTGTKAPATYPVTALTNGSSVEVDGLTFSLSGPMATGDSFTVKPVEDSLNSISLKLSDPSQVAAAGGPVAIAAKSANTGSGTLAITGLSGSPSFASPASISFLGKDAAGNQTYSISGSQTSDVTAAVLPASNRIVVDGVTVSLSGSPNAGDVFSLSNNTAGVGNNQNALALSSLQTRTLLGQGTVSFSGLYSTTIGAVGSTAAQYKATSASADGVLTAAVNSQQAVSGVNLDEEGATLIKFQQQYQACAKVVQIASTLFQSILQLSN